MPVESGAVERPATGLDESVPQRTRIGETTFAWVDEPARQAESMGEESEPPPLVLVHGFSGHRDDFIGVVPRLAAKRRVVVPDLRGHGDSEAKPGVLGWSLEQLMNDVVALLDHLGIDRCDLLGHSVGGMVALRTALAHPHRLRSLTLMCTAPEVPRTLSRERLVKAADVAEAIGMERLQELTEKAGRADCSASIRSWGERYWLHNRRRLLAMTVESYRGIGLALFDSVSQVARLPEVALPTLVLVGEFDHDWLPGADLFQEHVPGAHRATLADAEHHPHQENTRAWFESFESHLEAVGQAETDLARSASERT